MSWLQLAFETTKEHVDEISDQLMELGALSITLEDAKDQPLLEIYSGEKNLLWDAVRIIALFDFNSDFLELKSQIQEKWHSVISPIKDTIVTDQDWQNAWKQYVQPLSYGRLWICPNNEMPETEQAIIIKLDPGLAFGTGSHPTTALCLEWLEQHIKGGERIIDFGCGSGILAISALKVGAEKAYAIDCDKDALRTTQENCVKNAIDPSQIEILLPDVISKNIQGDVLIANILFNPLMELTEEFVRLLRSKGRLVLSGILHSQVESLIEKYQIHFEGFHVDYKEEWARIIAVKRR